MTAYPKPAAVALWLLAELAIVATDLAEVIGTAIGLNLLFGVPLDIGVLITALDVFLILYLQKLGFRYLEALIHRGLVLNELGRSAEAEESFRRAALADTGSIGGFPAPVARQGRALLWSWAQVELWDARAGHDGPHHAGSSTR